MYGVGTDSRGRGIDRPIHHSKKKNYSDIRYTLSCVHVGVCACVQHLAWTDPRRAREKEGSRNVHGGKGGVLRS